MQKSHKNSGTTHVQKIKVACTYDMMERTAVTTFQANHKPYQYPQIPRKQRMSANV